MLRKVLKFACIALIIILLAMVVQQGIKLQSNLKQIKPPTSQTRKLDRLGTIKWMTVDHLAQKYHISKSEIYSALNIKPEKGDDALTLEKLREKYGKTSDELKQAVYKLFKNVHGKVVVI